MLKGTELTVPARGLRHAIGWPEGFGLQQVLSVSISIQLYIFWVLPGCCEHKTPAHHIVISVDVFAYLVRVSQHLVLMLAF